MKKKYLIERGRYVASCEFDTQDQFDYFLKICQKECEDENNIFAGAQIEYRNYLDYPTYYGFEYRDNLSKTDADVYREAPVVGVKKPFLFISTKIYPDSVRKEAPVDFLDKQVNWDNFIRSQNKSDLLQKKYSCEDIRDMLRFLERAKQIRKNMKIENIAFQTSKSKKESRTSSAISKPKDKFKQLKKKQTRNKGSEYYEAVKERFGVLERVVKGIRALEEGTDERELAPDVLDVIDVLGEREEEGENKYEILLDMLKPKNIAQYLKDNNDRFRGERPTLDSVEKGVKRALKRNKGEQERMQYEIEKSIKGTPPPLADESLEEWGSEISPDDKNKEKQEKAVEDYFISFQEEALVKGTPRSEYISNVRALTLDVVAKHLKENTDVFKNWQVSVISSWLKFHSVEWRNRQLTLDVGNSDCDTNYDTDNDSYDAD